MKYLCLWEQEIFDYRGSQDGVIDNEGKTDNEDNLKASVNEIYILMVESLRISKIFITVEDKMNLQRYLKITATYLFIGCDGLIP